MFNEEVESGDSQANLLPNSALIESRHKVQELDKLYIE